MTCATCSDEVFRWLDMRPSQLTPPLLVSIGQGSARNVADANRSRSEVFRALVRRQTRAIIELCDGHTCDRATNPRGFHGSQHSE